MASTIETSRNSFLVTLFVFSIGVVLLGVADLHKRARLLPSPPPEVGKELVRELHGQINIKQRSQERAQEQQLAQKQRANDWKAVQRFLSTFVP
jgi:hypothetical protein